MYARHSSQADQAVATSPKCSPSGKQAHLSLARAAVYDQLQWIDSHSEHCDPLLICVAEMLARALDSNTKQVFAAHQTVSAVFCFIQLREVLKQVCLNLER